MTENRFITTAKKITQNLLISLGTVAITLPILALCLALTFVVAFGAASAVGGDLSSRLFRRVIQGVSLAGCIGSLVVNGFAIYYVNKFLEKRFKSQDEITKQNNKIPN